MGRRGRVLRRRVQWIEKERRGIAIREKEGRKDVSQRNGKKRERREGNNNVCGRRK
ncbi:hypothetical protein HN51_055490, partial [Arachis hypogaea]